jgi:hypothetical protein
MTALAIDTALSQHARIQGLSRGFAWLFSIAAFFYAAAAAALIAGTLIDNPYLFFGPKGGLIDDTPETPPLDPSYILMASVPIGQRLAFVLLGLPQFVPGILVLLNLRSLFNLYAAGIVFGPQNVLRFKHVGLWLIAHGLAPGVCQLAMRLAGVAFDQSWFHLASIQALVLGGILLVFSMVMEFGREIEQERAEFV